MILTNKQEQGLKIAIERYKKQEPYTCIAGYAGTGKSTLVKYIIDAIDVSQQDVCYIAYTGKASLVLKEKGCPNSKTAHRLLFQSFPRDDGTFYHKPRRPLEHNYKIIVVDEVSMLPKYLWDLLLSHGIYVIALGDPGQLPPIGEDNEILKKPHIFLDEVMRQAQESEIIRLTMDIRAEKPLTLYKGNEIQIINAKDVVSGMYTWADQVLVGKNDTRRQNNRLIRNCLFDNPPDYPIDGDKMICLKNDWESLNEAGDVLVNGSIGTVHNIKINNNHFKLKPQLLFDFISEEYGEQDIMLSPEDLFFRKINADYQLITTGQPTINKDNFKTFPRHLKPREFDFGYCITVHKSQGSEYNNVLVFEEFLKGSHKEWLYTATTRAKNRLVLVKGE